MAHKNRLDLSAYAMEGFVPFEPYGGPETNSLMLDALKNDSYVSDVHLFTTSVPEMGTFVQFQYRTRYRLTMHLRIVDRMYRIEDGFLKRFYYFKGEEDFDSLVGPGFHWTSASSIQHRSRVRSRPDDEAGRDTSLTDDEEVEHGSPMSQIGATNQAYGSALGAAVVPPQGRSVKTSLSSDPLKELQQIHLTGDVHKVSELSRQHDEQNSAIEKFLKDTYRKFVVMRVSDPEWVQLPKNYQYSGTLFGYFYSFHRPDDGFVSSSTIEYCFERMMIHGIPLASTVHLHSKLTQFLKNSVPGDKQVAFLLLILCYNLSAQPYASFRRTVLDASIGKGRANQLNMFIGLVKAHINVSSVALSSNASLRLRVDEDSDG